MQTVIKFHEEACQKPNIDMNTGLRKNANNDFKKDFFKMTNNAIFRKTMVNAKNHRDIKLVTTKAKMNYLVSGPKANFFYLTHFYQLSCSSSALLKVILLHKKF